MLGLFDIKLGVGAVLGALAAAGIVGPIQYHTGVAAGRAEIRAEIAAEDLRRTKDATDADEAARRCAADPQCRMRRDPYRRD